MSIKNIARMGATVTTVLLLTAGCTAPEGAVTQADLDALRTEIAQAQASSKAADASAAAAAADAAAARAAAEETKEIYMQSLRK
ncbi:MAG: hypothetical protein KAR37_17835 [Alphaproteobacteria bacterium]|nr:hypothetical protein [Alphaproteobacteria bacterium]